MLVHQRESIVTGLALQADLLPLVPGKCIQADDAQPEADRRDIRLVAVLLEEHPAQHVGSFEPVDRHEVGTVRQIEASRIALRNEAVPDLEHWNPAVGIDVGQELWGSGLALLDVVLTALEGNAEMCGGEPHLVAISRGPVFVEEKTFAHFRTSSTIFPTWAPASIRACASAARSSGKTASTTGFSRPPST